MPPEDVVRLRHMLDAARQVSAFVAGRSRVDLDVDSMLLFAVVRGLEVIGEAASRVSPAARDRAAEIEWAPIVGMRNRIVHAYFDVDPDIVWKAASEEVPALITQVERLLQAET